MPFFRRKSFLYFFIFGVLGIIFAFQGCGSPSPNSNSNALGIGDKLKDFSLLDENGHLTKLSDVPPGWFLVIYLYRGNYCSGCRDRLFKFKDDYSKFASLHAALMAVSTDPVEYSADFHQQWRFPFPFLSDPHLQLIDAFGARHPKGHGIHDVAHPSFIIIDSQKIIRFKVIAYKPDDEPLDDELLSIIQQLEGQKKT
jgi:peroxiredoxin